MPRKQSDIAGSQGMDAIENASTWFAWISQFKRAAKKIRKF
jgi:hypothetical protein